MSFKASYLSIAFFLLSITSICQTHSWERTNPGGGGAFSTIGASASGIIIAGSDLSGAYRSTNQGSTWDVIGSERGLSATHVSGVGFDPLVGNTLFIGTDFGIFRSNDGGESVQQVLDNGYITDIEIARSNTTVGYAAYHPEYDSNNGQVYKTNNNGLSWTPVSNNLPNGLRILKLLIHPVDENRLWLLSGDGRFACGPAEVWSSANGGVSWSQQGASLGAVLDINMDLEAEPYLFLSTMNADCAEEYYWENLEGSIYKSFDLGENWELMENRTGVIWVNWEQPDIIRLIDPREPFPWIDGAGTWESTDGSNTWQQIGDVADWDYGYQDAFWSYSTSFNGISKTLGEDLSNPNVLYWTNSQWVFGSFDGGATFQNLHTKEVSENYWQSTGFDNVNMMDIAISEVNPNRIYLAYFDIGLWRSIDNGESWQTCNHPDYTGGWEGFGGNTASVLADPTREMVVWTTMSANQNGESPTFLLKSLEGGERSSWILSNSGLPEEEIMGLSLNRLSPVNNRTLFCTGLGEVYRSEDDGSHWEKVLSNAACRFTAVDYFDENLIYAGGEGGLWRSLNGGDTWTEIGVAAMSGNSNIGFWEYNWEGIFEIKADPHHANWVYVCAFGNNKGLWRSKDRGNTWEQLLEDDFMRSMTISPNMPNLLYATSSSALEAGGFEENSKGILFSKDSGNSWEEVNEGMAWPFAVPIEISQSNWVFAGSPGTGFQKALVPETTSISGNSEKGDFRLFPNPGNGIVHLDFDPSINFSESKLEVFDTHGVLIFSQELSNTSQKLILNHLTPGLYLVKFTNRNQSITTKLIVQ